MKKSTLINEIELKTNYPKEEVENVVNSMLDIILQTLKNGESVSLYGFGSFSVSKREAKEIFLPGSSTKVKVPAKKIVKFKASKRLKFSIEEVD